MASSIAKPLKRTVQDLPLGQPGEDLHLAGTLSTHMALSSLHHASGEGKQADERGTSRRAFGSVLSQKLSKWTLVNLECQPPGTRQGLRTIWNGKFAGAIEALCLEPLGYVDFDRLRTG